MDVDAPPMSPARRQRSARGFTLIEMITALSIVALVGTFAVPTFLTMLRNNRLTGVSNDLLASLQNARTEAVKRQASTVLCTTADPAASPPVCTYGTGTGWVVFQDTNANWQADANEAVIERHPLIDTTISLRADGKAVVAFSPSGFATPSGAIAAMRNVVFCDARGLMALGANSSTGRAVVMTATGRARVTAVLSEVRTALTVNATCP